MLPGRYFEKEEDKNIKTDRIYFAESGYFTFKNNNLYLTEEGLNILKEVPGQRFSHEEEIEDFIGALTVYHLPLIKLDKDAFLLLDEFISDDHLITLKRKIKSDKEKAKEDTPVSTTNDNPEIEEIIYELDDWMEAIDKDIEKDKQKENKKAEESSTLVLVSLQEAFNYLVLNQVAKKDMLGFLRYLHAVEDYEKLSLLTE